MYLLLFCVFAIVEKINIYNRSIIGNYYYRYPFSIVHSNNYYCSKYAEYICIYAKTNIVLIIY
ncbi:hypothetical protein ACN75_19960 [Escherichia coli]|nr:hypothetical protein ACN75_19960 [Escherichia coli]